MKIFGNTSSLNMINQLKSYQNAMTKSMERITSGYGIVTPADSPVSYVMSERFRTELVDIRARQSNVQSGISLLQTGQTNLDRMMDILNDVKGRVEELNGPSNPDDIKHTGIYVDELLSEFGDIAETTHYNELHLFNSARTPQARSSWVTAFGPDMFQHNIDSAHGIRDTFDRFTIDNMLQDVNRTFVAGENGVEGNLEQVSKTFSGGADGAARVDMTETFQAQESRAVEDRFTASARLSVRDTFNYTNTQTDYTLTHEPNPGNLNIQLTETFDAGEQLSVARVNTSQVQVGDRIGDFEVTGLNFHGSRGHKMESMKVRYVGEEQNIKVEAYRGTRLDADDKINTFSEVQQGDEFTIQRSRHHKLDGTISLRATATGGTEGQTIDITDYEVAGEQRAINLDDVPFEGAIEVQINGETIDASNYTVNGDVLEFTGDLAPTFGDEVTVNFQAARGNERFDLGATPNAEPIEVLVNGEAVGADQYTIEGNEVVFVGADKPTYGDEVTVNFETGEKLTNLNVFDEVNPFPNEGTLQVFKNGQQLEEGGENGYTLDAGYVLFHGDAQGLEGDTYELQYQIGEDVTELELANAPNEGTIQVQINGEDIMIDPEDPSNGWTVEGNTLTLHGLAVPEIGDEVRVDYQTGEEFTQMALEQTGVNEETITVTVNGEELAAGEENGWSFDAETDTILFNGTGIPEFGAEVNVDYGVGPLMKEFELARHAIEGSFTMTVNGEAVEENAENGFTVDGRTVFLHGDAIPGQGDNIEFSYEYTGGADTDSDSPIILPSGMETKIQTPFVADFTLVGVGLDKIDLATEAGRDRVIESIETALDFALETQVRAGAQEQRLNYSLETLMDREAKVMQSDGEIRDAEMEKEMVNYMQAEMMANLTYSMLSQGNLNAGSVFDILGQTMMNSGGFGF